MIFVNFYVFYCSTMAQIELVPLEGGERVRIPLSKTTIGRGPFLQVSVASTSTTGSNMPRLCLIFIKTPC